MDVRTLGWSVGRSYGNLNQISRTDGLPYFLTNGAELRYKNFSAKVLASAMNKVCDTSKSKIVDEMRLAVLATGNTL